MNMKQRTIITLLFALVAMAGQAQEIRMNETTIDDYVPLLKAKGYVAYSFDTKDFEDAMAEPVIMEYVKGEEPKEVLDFSIAMSMGKKLVIGFVPSANDSTATYVYSFSESSGFHSPLPLIPLYSPDELRVTSL